MFGARGPPCTMPVLHLSVKLRSFVKLFGTLASAAYLLRGAPRAWMDVKHFLLNDAH